MEIHLPDFNSITAFLNEFPSRITIALLIALLSFSLLLFFYAFLTLKRLQFLFYKARDKYWSDVITQIFTEFLAYVDDAEEKDPVALIMPEIQKIPQNKLYIKKILYRQILNFHDSFTGNTAEKLRELFLKLELDKITIKRLNSSKREIKIKGIIETAQMQLNELTPFIAKLIHSKQPEVRIEAQAAYLILNKKHSFHFLEHIKEPILAWHQLILMDLTQRINIRELPDFSTWLNSNNNSVVELCIKLIGHFQQFKATDELIKLLNHPDEHIQLLTIKVLGDFEADQAEKHLLKLYDSGSPEIKSEVIKALGRICSGKQLKFLLAEAGSNEFDIVLQSVNALSNHGNSGLDLIKHYYPNAPKMNKAIIGQVLETAI